MLDVESRTHDVDYTKLTSTTVNRLTRELAKTPVAPLMEQHNPAKQGLLRDLRNAVRKANGDCTVYVAFDSKKITVGYRKGHGIYVYELVFKNAVLVRLNDAAAAYDG